MYKAGYEDPREVTYKCGHITTIGGNVADPSCEYPRDAGLLKFVVSEELCDECSGKFTPPKGHFTGNLETGMTWVYD